MECIVMRDRGNVGLDVLPKESNRVVLVWARTHNPSVMRLTINPLQNGGSTNNLLVKRQKPYPLQHGSSNSQPLGFQADTTEPPIPQTFTLTINTNYNAETGMK